MSWFQPQSNTCEVFSPFSLPHFSLTINFLSIGFTTKLCEPPVFTGMTSWLIPFVEGINDYQIMTVKSVFPMIIVGCSNSKGCSHLLRCICVFVKALRTSESLYLFNTTFIQIAQRWHKRVGSFIHNIQHVKSCQNFWCKTSHVPNIAALSSDW